MRKVAWATELPSDLVAAKKALRERHLTKEAVLELGHLFAMPVAARQPTTSHLHAIGIGRKVVDGKLTDTLSVRFYVTSKLTRRVLGRNRLPESIDGIPTDVIESPPAYLAVASLCSLRKLREQRPALGGISGANESIAAGTLGARCRSRRPAESLDRFVLANCHTLADLGVAPLGSAIVQPASRDGGTSAANTLAILHRFVPVVESATAANRVDAAVAKLSIADSMSTGVCTVGQIRGTTSPTVEARIHKHGRTSGYTTGMIDDPVVETFIPLRREDPMHLTQFVDQLRIRPQVGQTVFAQPGDSGALVLTKPGNMAVGLLFACPDDGSFAYANPMTAVLDALEIDLE